MTPDLCHCGAPVMGDRDTTRSPAGRHLCERCLPLRCDAPSGGCADLDVRVGTTTTAPWNVRDVFTSNA